ncbi:hypothetical protein MHBO_004709 [Bonamia ostreae]|uniref:tRNA-binding domain-containing protein n=1 Tax=Bonamia ostreae TaxID=126728 RepID=A0ABV2AU22_9EUKA
MSLNKTKKLINDALWNPNIPVGHTAFSWNVNEKSPVKDETNAIKKETSALKYKKMGEKSENGQTKKVLSPFDRLDIRVGKIVDCQKHPNAEKMYVEKIDLGEESPRQIISGLSDYIPISEMKTDVLVVANLKSF